MNTSLGGEMIATATELQQDGFVAINYPGLAREKANQLVEKWIAFCELPREEKEKLARPHFDDLGYEWKGDAGYRDRKENFDVKLNGIDSLLAEADASGMPPIARELIECAESVILDAVSPVASRFAEKLEQLFGIVGLEEEVMKARGLWQVRLLHYLDDTLDKEVAGQHVDKSGFTLHLHESGPGLQYLDWQKSWQDVSFGNGQTVIFPGLQMQLRSKGAITGLCHRVVGRGAGNRYSAVCFVLLADTPFYDKARLGPSQSQEPGYNYSLPLEVLKKFFTDRPLLS